MTTIIVIVVVALVFFVTVCVSAFLIWKRETEMRTDSIKAIEHNLEEMIQELTQETDSRVFAGRQNRSDRSRKRAAEQMTDRLRHESQMAYRRKNADPFEWVRTVDNVNDSAANTLNDDAWTYAINEERRKVVQAYEDSNAAAKTAAAEETKSPLYKVLDRFNETLDALKPDKNEKQKRNVKLKEFQDDLIPVENTEVAESSEKSYKPETEDKPEIEPDVKTQNDSDLKSTPESEAVSELNSEEQKEEQQSVQTDFDDTTNFDDTTDFDDTFFRELEAAETEIIDEMAVEEHRQKNKQGYDVGRSGKKYTALELETLIRE